MLATFIVGFLARPCQTSLLFPMFQQQVCRHHLHMVAAHAINPSTCNCFKSSRTFTFSSRKMTQVAYHFEDVTDVKAMAL